ncbi:hypothetical protein QAD02_008668 [Eretmocerus hayati]|uniref:Uncharacterized protein n=1 Tax=Eretmocerus hayati TaxID=131215 RepID=A0ACC2N7Y3_9HYME|nr:hypothetical protein QAD02_008668 [Eretmocerus hayati]
MVGSKKLQKALRFTKYSINLTLCWPPAEDASRMETLIFDFLWWLMFISALCLFLPLGASIYVNRDNPESMTQSIALWSAVGACVIKSFFAKIRRSRLQKLIGEMEEFIGNLNDADLLVIEKYVSKHSALHITVTVLLYFTAVSFLIVPLVTDRRFPCDAVYPFSLESPLMEIIIYLHQSLVAFQCAAGILVDCFTAMVVWFLCARFELTALAIKNFRSTQDLKNLIRQHQELIEYADEVRDTLSLFVLSVITTTVGGMIFSTIQLVVDQPATIKAQFAIAGVSAGVGSYICSLAAESLHEMGYAVGDQAFESDWITKDREARICLIHIIRRAQKPIDIKANEIIPPLSLEFFCQVRNSRESLFSETIAKTLIPLIITVCDDCLQTLCIIENHAVHVKEQCWVDPLV